MGTEVLHYLQALVKKSGPCDPYQSLSCIRLFVISMDCSPPGSSVHGILQATILEWVSVPFSRGSSQPRDRT